jgi:hypothetical protein
MSLCQTFFPANDVQSEADASNRSESRAAHESLGKDCEVAFSKRVLVDFVEEMGQRERPITFD